MESGEGDKEGEGEETNGFWRIAVEAKFFTCHLAKESFILKETHKRWERALSLSLDQARWLGRGLLDRSKHFGETPRKETKLIDGKLISLIEGSNAMGCFISVQVTFGKAGPIFLVVPTGKKGYQWGRVSELIDKAIM